VDPTHVPHAKNRKETNESCPMASMAGRHSVSVGYARRGIHGFNLSSH